MSSDLISRAALLKECEERQKSNPVEDGRGWADHFLNDGMEPSTEWNSVEEMIEYAPAVDAIPVEWLKGLMLSTEDDVDKAEFAWIIREWQDEQEAR